jgi:hypothetical protein
MGRKCIVCGQMFGCIRGKIRYLCEDCRLAEGCGIRNHFSTTRLTYEICDRCLKGEELPERPLSGNLRPLLKRRGEDPFTYWS